MPAPVWRTRAVVEAARFDSGHSSPAADFWCRGCLARASWCVNGELRPLYSFCGGCDPFVGQAAGLVTWVGRLWA